MGINNMVTYQDTGNKADLCGLFTDDIPFCLPMLVTSLHYLNKCPIQSRVIFQVQFIDVQGSLTAVGVTPNNTA